MGKNERQAYLKAIRPRYQRADKKAKFTILDEFCAIDDTDDPESRFVNVGPPWVLVDGAVVAADWADLTDGELSAGINITETGEKHAAWEVWTNVNVDGTANSSDNCQGWTDPFPNGNWGLSGFVDWLWTDADLGTCLGSYRLYCFQQ